MARSSERTASEEHLRILKERAESGERFAEVIAESARVVHPVRTISREDSKSGVASKLKKTGVTLIALPDPVTGAVGVPVLAAGFALEKLGKRDLSLPQVTGELTKTMKELERLRKQTL